MCSTSRTSISPDTVCQLMNKRQQVTEVFVAIQHLLKSNNSNKSFVQQSSTVNLFKYSSIQEDVSNSGSPCRMPRFLVCTALYSVQMWSAVKGTIFPYWRIITGGMNCVLHEPITSSVNFDIFI